MAEPLMKYPNVLEIRERLDHLQPDVAGDFRAAAIQVCNDSVVQHACVVSGAPLPNTEAIIVLRFIENVLNGTSRRC